jgi:hypothetical protein
MTAPLVHPAEHPEDSFDGRWARWQEAGAAQDRLWTRRVLAVAVLTLCGVATWLAVAIFQA